ncbi:Crp/Fnr family transcriptional regulator [Salipaludibacillus sp. CUR1]|uniref:Crp/Fnr family transcriptional regulator n=1 Tax=Salipaludibacillus sp. CUR1 TaxID=2820003 RepID=UPI001E2D6B2D|nr:Crp/Fnr family transcriptional regulator [Salipaludibacillus sp. CUR1]MCE7794900.1 Crp/Fnr family transcriptional regulator [Salipaludibacillus sp. CUR1]
MSTKSFLHNIPVFAPLPDTIKVKLEEIILTKAVTKGEVLFRETEPAESLYFINEGKVKLTKSSADGKEIVLNIRQKDEIFAEVALFSPEETTYPATATVLEGGSVSYIRNEDLEMMLLEHPELGMPIFRIMAERLRISQTTLRDVALYGKLSALAATLVRLTEDYGIKKEDGIYIDIKLTHEDLGNFFGATRESVTRMMNQLKKQKILSKKQGYLVIHDLEELKTYMHDA